jgi:hypothetical protein
MAIHGDFYSFPLPELLQWLDGSRKSGVLQMTWEAGDRKIFVLQGQLFATSGTGVWERIARILAVSRIAQGEKVMEAFAEMRETGDAKVAFSSRGMLPTLPGSLAREELYGAITDLIRSGSGQFHWSEDEDKSGEEWVPVDTSLRGLLFEALRWLDEQNEVDKALPSEATVVQSAANPSNAMPLIHRVLLTLCTRGQSLGKLRMAMALPRSTVHRRVYDLFRLKMMTIEGAPELAPDPIGEMLQKGTVLIEQQQYDAAELICSSILASDPTDTRVREFARMVESEHVAALYRELPPMAVLELIADPRVLSQLRPAERQVASLLNGSWDVSTVVLASQGRELETLKTLKKLTRMGVVTQRG